MLRVMIYCFTSLFVPIAQAQEHPLMLQWDRTSDHSGAPAPHNPGGEAQGNSAYGWNVVPIGDFNGDGHADVAVTAGGWVLPNSTIRQGAVFIYLGRGTPFLPQSPQLADYILTSDLIQGGGFGHDVAVGDLNGDGRSDLIVGAPYAESRGAIYAFYGRPGLPVYHVTDTAAHETLLPAWKRVGPTGALYYGWNVELADVNCDVRDDVIVSTHWYGTAALPHQGLVHVYYAPPSPPGIIVQPSPSPNWSQMSGEYLSEYGWGLAAPGDMTGDYDPTDINGDGIFDHAGTPDIDTNGDGLPDQRGCEDFVVGAPRYGGDHRGRVYLYRGTQAGPALISTYSHDVDRTRYGERMAGAGDANGDGKADLLVFSQDFDPSSALTDAGATFLVSGGMVLGQGTPLQYDAQPGARFGTDAAAAGDVNGDNCDDFVVGQGGWDGAQPEIGRMYLYLGVGYGCWGDGQLLVADRIWFGPGIGAGLGAAVDSAGDLDGDGRSEMLVGMPAWDGPNAAPNVGRVGSLRY